MNSLFTDQQLQNMGLFKDTVKNELLDKDLFEYHYEKGFSLEPILLYQIIRRLNEIKELIANKTQNCNDSTNNCS